MRVPTVEDEPRAAEAIRDSLRLEAIAADLASTVSGTVGNACDLATVPAVGCRITPQPEPGEEAADRG